MSTWTNNSPPPSPGPTIPDGARARHPIGRRSVAWRSINQGRRASPEPHAGLFPSRGSQPNCSQPERGGRNPAKPIAEAPPRGRQDAVAAGQGVGVERRGGRRRLRHRRRQRLRGARRHPAALRRPLHQLLHQGLRGRGVVPGDILRVQEGGRDPEPVRVPGAADGRPASLLPEERTSCIDRKTSTIPSHPPSCRAMASSYAASSG